MVQPLLENRKFFRAVISGIAIFLAKELVRTSRIKISTKELLFRSSYFCADSFWRGLIFQKNNILY